MFHFNARLFCGLMEFIHTYFESTERISTFQKLNKAKPSKASALNMYGESVGARVSVWANGACACVSPSLYVCLSICVRVNLWFKSINISIFVSLCLLFFRLTCISTRLIILNETCICVRVRFSLLAFGVCVYIFICFSWDHKSAYLLVFFSLFFLRMVLDEILANQCSHSAMYMKSSNHFDFVDVSKILHSDVNFTWNALLLYIIRSIFQKSLTLLLLFLIICAGVCAIFSRSLTQSFSFQMCVFIQQTVQKDGYPRTMGSMLNR